MKKRNVTDIDKTVIREDTRIALQKVNEMKSSWGDLFGAVPGIAAKALNKFSRYSKTISTQADPERFKDIPREIKREPGSPEAKQAADQLTKDKAKPNVGTPTSDLPDTRDPRGDAAPNMAKAKEIAAKTGSTRNDSSGKAVEGGAKYEPEAPKTSEAPKTDASGTSKTAQSFKQAFAAARKEAGGGKGQFEYGGKKYQTNIAPAKGAEKYISASKQKVTSVKSDAGSTPAKAEPKPTPAETPKAQETPKTQEAPKTDTNTTPTATPTQTTPQASTTQTTPSSSKDTGKGAVTTAPDGADGASVSGGKGGKGGKGGANLGESVIINGNKYRII